MEVQMPIDIPLGQPFVILPDDPADSAQQATEALTAVQAGKIDVATCRAQLNALAARYPTSISTWAALGELSLPDDVIAAYAFFRTGYHRGLDQLRRNGWKGFGPVPYGHEPNRGFLRCVAALARAADSIGEADEYQRCLDLLDDCDPAARAALGLS